MSTIFKGKKTDSGNKLQGSYYTPSKIAQFLTDWAIRKDSEIILEPSCGNGNFLESVLNTINRKSLQKCKLSAIEIDENAFNQAKKRVNDISVNKHIDFFWKNEDFFEAYESLKEKKFNVVIGNPPFIRFQNFDIQSRDLAFKHLKQIGYKPTKLANVWAAFVQLSIELVDNDGRIAMVIPAELLQVKYAAELRERITLQFQHVILVTFKKLVFPDIQQEVVLLLAEGKKEINNSYCDIHTIDIEDEHELDQEIFSTKIKHAQVKHTHPGIKWTSFFLQNQAFELLDTIHQYKICKLGDFVSVDVGIVTGRNSFFVVNKNTVEQFELGEFVIPLVGKTSAISSVLYSVERCNNYADQHDGYLLDLKNKDENTFSRGLKKYISLGEQENVHIGYKCRIRKRWYDVPSVKISDGFLFRQIHRYPLLVDNEAKVACTDTIHRVNLLNNDIKMGQLACSFVNSLTFAWCEIAGRSYGGGVLELEPHEAEQLPLPYSTNFELDEKYVNDLIVQGDIEKALDYVDEILLIKHLKFQKEQVLLLRESWKTLRDRRIFRK